MDTFFELDFPKLLGMTLVSFAVASAVGELVDWISTLICRLGKLNLELAQPTRSLIDPAILRAFICLLLGMLTYEANPGSLVSGPYGGLALFVAYVHYEKWHSYDLENMSAGYFIANVLDSLSPESIARHSKWWFPEDSNDSNLFHSTRPHAAVSATLAE